MGAKDSSGNELGADERLKLIDRFLDNIADLNQRWDDRLTNERMVALGELYLNGRIEILAYGDWPGTVCEKQWLCRISPHPAISHREIGSGDVYIADPDYRDGGNDEVVFVEVAQVVEAPKLLVRSICRTYLIEKKFFGSGEGSLYRREGRVGYEVFPLWMDREVGFEARRVCRGADNSTGKVIKCRTHIVDSVTDDDCQRLWDSLYGPVHGNLKKARIWIGDHACITYPNPVEVPIQGIGSGPQFINVAVGPLNLEPRAKKDLNRDHEQS